MVDCDEHRVAKQRIKIEANIARVDLDIVAGLNDILLANLTFYSDRNESGKRGTET